jgi:phenylacetate-CoA ligase
MVKLRGVNIWPEAIGEVALQDPRLENEYFVRAVREGERDEMIAHVTTRAEPSQYDDILRATEARLKERFGVRIKAEVSGPDTLDAWTEIKTSPKPKRFRDER